MVKLPLFLRTKLGHIQYLFTPFLMGIPHNFTLFLPYNCFLTSPFPSHLPSSLVNLLTLSFDHFCYFVIFVTLWLCDCVIVVGKRGGSRPNFWQPAAHVIYGPKLGQVTLTHAPPAVSDVVELSRTACLDSRAPCDASRRLFIA